MGPWIAAERARLDDLLERLSREEVEGRGEGRVPGAGLEYGSSREMFGYIKVGLGLGVGGRGAVCLNIYALSDNRFL